MVLLLLLSDAHTAALNLTDSTIDLEESDELIMQAVCTVAKVILLACLYHSRPKYERYTVRDTES